MTGLRQLAGAARAAAPRPARVAAAAAPLKLTLDGQDLDGFARVAAGFGSERFGYAVTANADHLLRLHRDPDFQDAYASADYTLLDSRFLSLLLRLTRRLALPVCTGSDLTARLFSDIIQPDDRVVLIGGSAAQAAQLGAERGLRGLVHYNPPMGFIRDPAAVEECLRFVEANSPFRYCLLAVGSPQQEMLAQRLKARGVARGLALCIGASINFLTGVERRAPRWMQRNGLEWCYRLMQAPRRMGPRYLWHGPRVFALLRRTEVRLRGAAVAGSRQVDAVAVDLAVSPRTTPPALRVRESRARTSAPASSRERPSRSRQSAFH